MYWTKAMQFGGGAAASHPKEIRGAPREIPSFGVACGDDASAPYFAAATSKRNVSLLKG